MIGVSHISVAAYRGGGAAPINPDFVSTWDTTQAGSASDTVVLPLLSGGTYSGTIDWGDSTTSPLSYANRSHTYLASGTYTITISGTIGGWRFANAGDKNKIIDISNWGTLDVTTDQVFFGCVNLFISATDAPIVTTTSVYRMFYVALNANPLFTGIDFSGVTNFFDYARGVSAGAKSQFNNAGVSNYDMSSATNLRGMFRHGTLDQDLSSWDITNVTDALNFMEGSNGLSTSNYDATLIGWEATLQAAYPAGVGYPATISIHFGGSQYTGGGAADAARASLISTFGWTITDGGAV